MAYRVTAPMVNLKIKDPVTGAYTVQGFYEGAVVDDIEPDNLRHHLDGDMVEEVADPAAARSDKDQGPAKGRRAAHDDD
jgi:hypothetical protein